MILTLMLVLVVFGDTRTSPRFCQITSCSELSIDFPFSLKEANQGRRCGYPGFELSCNNRSQALLSLPNSADLVVTRISLEDQQASVNDPRGCLPRRILDDFSLDGSAFQLDDSYYLLNYSFLNCPSNATASYAVPPISCLATTNDHNHSVIAVLSNPPYSISWTSSCQLISSAMVPVTFNRLYWINYEDDILLQWSEPNCGYCEAQGGRCGFLLGDSGPYVGCYNLPSQSQGIYMLLPLQLTHYFICAGNFTI